MEPNVKEVSVESKLTDLKEGEFIGHELVWMPGKFSAKEDMIVQNMKEGIGSGIRVTSPDEKQHIALLIDIDFDTNPHCRRFIFALYNKHTKREHIIDTLYSVGWTVCYENQYYKL